MKRIIFLFTLFLMLTTSGFAQKRLTNRPGSGPDQQALQRNLENYFAQRQNLAARETLRVLAIRVEFQRDTLSETTATGEFDLSTASEPVVDPGPHDKAYFDAQMRALSNYYQTVSNGNLQITWQIYPQENTAAYKLPHDLQYYAPNDDTPLVDTRLAALFRDGFTLADANENLDFSQFDSFILFHAGVGNDINFDFDSTPNDITSVFLRFEDLKKEFGPEDANYQGIAVNSASFFIRNGIILPETESQEGFEIGLLGTMTFMTGFQLGLPALFDTETGGTGIGRWGLMDQGSGNAQGLLPAEPNAWEKIFMGWEKPIVIKQGEQFQIGAPRSGFPNHIYKIPISNDEYFLIENRQQDVNGDSVARGTDVNGNSLQFNRNGQLVSNEVIGVVTSVDEYDFGLPGSGILIWHIDDAVIREKIADNAVNSDKDHRGVDLEEADVAQDYGYFYDFIHRGFGKENGWWADAWFDSNYVNLQAHDTDKISFGPDTRPSSRSNSRANTGIRMYDFSGNKAMMSFSLATGFSVSGFPVYSPDALFPPLVGEFDPTYIGEEIITISTDGAVLAWHGDGSPLLPNTVQKTIDSPGNELRTFEIPLALQLNELPVSYPVVADIDGDTRDELIFCAANGALTAIQTIDRNRDNQFDFLWQLNLGFKTSSALLFADGNLLFATDKLMTIDAGGNVVNSLPLPADMLDMSYQQGKFNLIAANGFYQADESVNLLFGSLNNAISLSSGEFGHVIGTADKNFILNTQEESGVFQLDNPFNSNRAAIGDVDGDGRQDIVFTNTQFVGAFNQTGAALENFPVRTGTDIQSDSVQTASEPVLLDMDGDGAQEIFTIGAKGDLWGIENDGSIVDGFPLAVAGTENKTITAGDIDSDGELELLVVTSDGFLHAFDLNGAVVNARHAWLNFGGNRAQTRSNIQSAVPQMLSGKLLPQRFAYNYPNPTEGAVTTIRYRLTEDAAVNIKIFDLAGDLVTEMAGPGFGNLDNEVIWQLGDIQNGVYVARIEAQATDKSDFAIFKISVIK